MFYTEFRCYCNHINTQNYSNYYSDYHFMHILIGPSGIALFTVAAEDKYCQLWQQGKPLNYEAPTLSSTPPAALLRLPSDQFMALCESCSWALSYTMSPGIKTQVLGLLFKADCIKSPFAKVSARAPIPMKYWMALLIHIFTLLILWTFPHTLLKPLKLFVFCTKGPKVYLGAH